MRSCPAHRRGIALFRSMQTPLSEGFVLYAHPLNNPLTCKNFTRFFIPPAARKLRIDYRVAN
jgi:hypothetical protein